MFCSVLFHVKFADQSDEQTNVGYFPHTHTYDFALSFFLFPLTRFLIFSAFNGSCYVLQEVEEKEHQVPLVSLPLDSFAARHKNHQPFHGGYVLRGKNQENEP